MQLAGQTSDPAALYRALTPLRHIKRFQLFPLIARMSVAEHSYYAGLLAGVFAGQLQSLGVRVDRTLAIEAALWHDAAESFTGDMPAQTKREFPQLAAVMDDVERECEITLGRLNGRFPWPSEGSLEQLLVKLADLVELLLYAESERRAGNPALVDAEERVWGWLRGELSDRFEVQPVKVKLWYWWLLRRLSLSVGGPIVQGVTVGDLKWAAGFLEGDGSFQTLQVAAGQNGNPFPLVRLRRLFGGKIWTRKKRSVTGKPVQGWAVHGPRAVGVMMSLYTFLGPGKRQQVRSALKQWRARPGRGRRSDLEQA